MMKRIVHRIGIWGLIVSFLVSAFLGIASLSASNAYAQKKELVVGCTLPLTGAFSAFGRFYLDAYRYWESEVNAEGGLLGRKVRLIVYDDKSNASTSVNLYQKLLTVDKVDFIVGGFPTPPVVPIMALAEKFRRLFVVGGSNSMKLLEKGRYKFTFTTIPMDRVWAKSIFDYLATLPPGKRPQKVGFVQQVNLFLVGIVDAMKPYAKKKGFKVFGVETYASNTQDFTAMVEKFKAANVDFLFGSNNYPAGLSLLRAVAEVGYKPRVIFMSVGPTVPKWIKDLGSRTDHVFTTTPYWHTLKTANNKSFSRGIKKRYGYTATRETGMAYSALQTLTQAIRGAKTFDQIKLRDYLRANKIDTVSGPMEFDELGIGTRNVYLMQVQGTKQLLVYPNSVREAEPVYPRP